MNLSDQQFIFAINHQNCAHLNDLFIPLYAISSDGQRMMAKIYYTVSKGVVFMKKFMSMLLAVAMMLSIAIPCSATSIDETSDVILTDEQIRSMCSANVELTESLTRGTSAPTEGWNCETQGSLSFSGSTSYSTLWLNKLVWGCTGYRVYINNKSSSTLSFHARGCTNDAIYEVPANSAKSFYFPMASASDYFCITFNAPSNFSGYVSCGCIIGG